MPRLGLRIAAFVSIGGGLVLAVRDSSPGYDDTGITAIGLVLVAGVAAFAAGRRPWVWALTTGMWVPLFELSAIGSGGPLAGFVFSAIGAAAGWMVAASTRDRGGTSVP